MSLFEQIMMWSALYVAAVFLQYGMLYMTNALLEFSRAWYSGGYVSAKDFSLHSRDYEGGAPVIVACFCLMIPIWVLVHLVMVAYFLIGKSYKMCMGNKNMNQVIANYVNNYFQRSRKHTDTDRRFNEYH